MVLSRTFGMIIQGTVSGGPTTIFRKFIVEESSNTELQARKASTEESPSFNKTFHNAGTVGELWKDEIEAVKTDESIS